jgi:hypothetical protein
MPLIKQLAGCQAPLSATSAQRWHGTARHNMIGASIGPGSSWCKSMNSFNLHDMGPHYGLLRAPASTCAVSSDCTRSLALMWGALPEPEHGALLSSSAAHLINTEPLPVTGAEMRQQATQHGELMSCRTAVGHTIGLPEAAVFLPEATDCLPA